MRPGEQAEFASESAVFLTIFPDKQVTSLPLDKMILLLSSLVCSIFLFLLCFSDIWLFIRVGLFSAYAFCQKVPRDLFKTIIVPSVVLTSDLDYMLHMNNARYLREADIARYTYFCHYKFMLALKACRANTVLSASCSRHRQPLSLFERFDIHTRILGWDDHAFYLEQQFISRRKGFVAAVIHCRHHVVGATPGVLMENIAREKVKSWAQDG